MLSLLSVILYLIYDGIIYLAWWYMMSLLVLAVARQEEGLRVRVSGGRERSDHVGQ